jgi:tetratricopeptide (TPR) repeat protein
MKKSILIILVLVFSSLLLAGTKVDELVEKSYEYENNGNYQQALTNMFAVTHLAPSDAYYNLRTAWLYYSLYNYTDALKYYTVSYNLDNNLEALEGIVVSNYMLGNWQETIEYGKQVISINPQSFLTLAKIAYSYYALQDWQNAASYYQQACDIYSYNISCLGYYLSSLVESNQINKAKSVFQKLKKMNPSNEFIEMYESKLK